MPKTKEYCEDLKKLVVDAVQSGMTKAAAARQFKVSKQTVAYWIKIFKNRGTLKRGKRQGRPRKTSKRDDTVISRICKSSPRMSAVQITAEFNKTASSKIHPSTVKRRLRADGLFGRRPSRKPMVSAKNRRDRLDFARNHINWTTKDWSKILWSDESKFNLFSSDGIRFVRRPKNKRNDVRYMVPTVKHGGGSVMVWGCFSRDCVGPLVRINGIMDSKYYLEIIKEHMLTHAKTKMPRGWIFQQDNDPKHRSMLTRDFFSKKKIRDLKWPSQSPDLNPIEHLWEELDRCIRVENYANTNDLFLALKQSWEKIPLSKLIKLVDSMPSRCAAVIASKGYPTSY